MFFNLFNIESSKGIRNIFYFIFSILLIGIVLGLSYYINLYFRIPLKQAKEILQVQTTPVAIRFDEERIEKAIESINKKNAGYCEINITENPFEFEDMEESKVAPEIMGF